MHRTRFFLSPWPYLSAAFISILYFVLFPIGDWLGQQPEYAMYADRDIPMIRSALQRILTWPWSKWIGASGRHILVFPWWVVIMLTIRGVYVQSRRFWNLTFKVSVLAILAIYCFPDTLLWLENDRPSRSIGTPGNGRIENAKRLPFRGENFTTYSFPGYLMGRTFVHEKVRSTLLDAFRICETTSPGTIFVIGETGRRKGGLFLPHRSHKNGMSVDLMTPMLKNGNPWASHHLLNLWGYGIEFDRKGRVKKAEIDYETLARQLAAIRQAARENGLKIRRIIFDPDLQPFLFASDTGKKIKDLPYMKSRAVIRHDDHYHLDFE